MVKKIQALLFILIPLFVGAQVHTNEFEELANGYFNQGKTSQAAEFYSKAGYSYWSKEENKQAIAAFQKAYELFFRLDNTKAAITVGNNLGLLNLDIENYKNASIAFNNVLQLTRKSKNTVEIFNALVNVGTVAMELSSFKDAISKTTEALSIAKETNNLKYMAKCYSLLAETYEKMSDASNAFKYFELYSSIDKKIKMQEMETVKQMSTEEINKAHETKRITEIELKIKKGELKLTQDSLVVSERIAYERQMQVELRNEQLKQKEIQLRYEMQVRRTLILGILITAVFLFILGILLFQKFRDNKTLRLQKEEITLQRNILDVQNKKITDSIHYGLRIQQAMLPNIDEIRSIFQTMIIYKPKDIVSGDFYWFYKIIKKDITEVFIAVIDCTGHGVPGAFMSMIGHRLLTEIVVEQKNYQPSIILEEIDQKLKIELHQDNNKSMDGMDVAFCRITISPNQETRLIFAGAKRPLYIQRKTESEILILEGNHKSIGGYKSKTDNPFTDKTSTLNTGDRIFMFTDGIIDQQNQFRDRFGSTRLNSLINEGFKEPLSKTKENIEVSLDNFRGTEDQRDDITVVGLQIN